MANLPWDSGLVRKRTESPAWLSSTISEASLMDKVQYILCCQNIGVFDPRSVSNTRLFVICSTRCGCGKSTFSAYLGEILRREGRHVVWMDFDASQPKQWASFFGVGATFAACVELERALYYGHTVIAFVDRPLKMTAVTRPPIYRHSNSWGHTFGRVRGDFTGLSGLDGDLQQFIEIAGLPLNITRQFAGSLFVFHKQIANPCVWMTEVHAHIPSYKSLLAVAIELVLRRFDIRAQWDTALTAAIHGHLFS